MRFMVYRFFWVALTATLLLGAGGGSGRAQSDEVRQACTGDAMQFCSAVIPDVPKITVCMKRNYRRLSMECRHAMARTPALSPHSP
jgi:hypothetical protein